jgi:hypothetical protein
MTFACKTHRFGSVCALARASANALADVLTPGGEIVPEWGIRCVRVAASSIQL